MEIKYLKEEKIKDILRNLKKINFKENALLKAVVLILPLILVFYLGINIYNAYNYKTVCSIDFNKENFKNTELPLYIDEEPDSPKFMSSGSIINDVYYTEITGSPISFVWQPEEFPLNKTISVSAFLKGEGDWEISLVCPNCSKEEKYDWQPFYYGKLNDYVLAANFGNLYIYSLYNNLEWQKAGTIEQWLEKNIPQGASIEILNNVYPKSKLVNPNIDFIEGGWTKIDKTLRGPHQFYVYLKDKLDLEVIKKDLNGYDGADDVNMILYDLEDNIITQIKIEDDGIDISDQNIFAPVVKKRVEHNIEKEGVYKLTFEEAGAGKSDWTIKYLKINTNKIIFTGNTNLILDPGTLYTELSENKELKIYAWHGNAVQTIKFKGENTTQELEITENELEKWQFVELNPGGYKINFAGDQHIGGANFAINKESYFEPFVYDLSKSKNSSIVLADYLFEKGDEWIKTSKNYTKENFEKIDNLKEIKFLIRNKKLEKKFREEQKLYDNGFHFLAKFNKYKLLGKKGLNVYVSEADNIIDWLKDLIPEGSALGVNKTLEISQSDFINNEEPEGFTQFDNPSNELNFALRGSHEFYVYVNNHFKAEIIKEDLNTYEGKDEVKISLINSQGELLCDKIMEDDGNEFNDKNIPSLVKTSFNCPNLKKGVYILKLEGMPAEINNINNDFIIRQLKVNTNKIIIKDRILNIEPIELYVNNKCDNEIDLFYWHKGKNQIIEITGKNGKNIELTESDYKKNKKRILTDGEKKLSLPKGDVVISDNNFAFKKENWFYPTIISVKNHFNADFVLLEDIYEKPLFIKNINIDVR